VLSPGDRPNRGDRRWIALQNRGHETDVAPALECLLACQHLVQHDAKGKDVRPRVRISCLDLLGTHVLQRPENRPFERQLAIDGRDGGKCNRRSAGGLTKLGEPEVEE
jgi:hypothetical protein